MNKAAKIIGYTVLGYIAFSVVCSGISAGLRANYKRHHPNTN